MTELRESHTAKKQDKLIPPLRADDAGDVGRRRQGDSYTRKPVSPGRQSHRGDSFTGELNQNKVTPKDSYTRSRRQLHSYSRETVSPMRQLHQETVTLGDSYSRETVSPAHK